MKTKAETAAALVRIAQEHGRASRAVSEDLKREIELESVRTLPKETRIQATHGEAIIHVDSLRMQANQALNFNDPIVRIVVDGEVFHARQIEILGPSTLAEDYDNPLHDRPSAVCVLTTRAVIRIVR
jgi:hypothetical protein